MELPKMCPRLEERLLASSKDKVELIADLVSLSFSTLKFNLQAILT
jgi:hypothetical protein